MEGEPGLSTLRLQGCHFILQVIRSGVQRPCLEQQLHFQIFINLDADINPVLSNAEFNKPPRRCGRRKNNHIYIS